MKIIKNDDYCYMDNGTFPYCDCKLSNKDIIKHAKFNNDGCYYIDKIFSTFNVKRLVKYLNEYELYEVINWEDVQQWGIKNAFEIADHFTIRGKFATVIPKFVCKKVDDEFEHSIKLKLDHSMFNGYDRTHTKENGRSTQAWCVLNTDNDEFKIIGQCVVWNELH